MSVSLLSPRDKATSYGGAYIPPVAAGAYASQSASYNGGATATGSAYAPQPPLAGSTYTSHSAGSAYAPQPPLAGSTYTSHPAGYAGAYKPLVVGGAYASQPAGYGALYTPQPAIVGGAYRPAVTGSAYTPQPAVTGSAYTPQPAVTGSAYTPQPAVTGSAYTPQQPPVGVVYMPPAAAGYGTPVYMPPAAAGYGTPAYMPPAAAGYGTPAYLSHISAPLTTPSVRSPRDKSTTLGYTPPAAYTSVLSPRERLVSYNPPSAVRAPVSTTSTASVYTYNGTSLAENSDSGKYYNLGTGRMITTLNRLGYDYLDAATLHGGKGGPYVTGEKMLVEKFKTENATSRTASSERKVITTGVVGDIGLSCITGTAGTAIFTPRSTDVATIPDSAIETLCDFHLEGLTGKGKMVRVIDGDTAEVLLYVPLHSLTRPTKKGRGRGHMQSAAYVYSEGKDAGFFAKYKCRLWGIDAAEHNTAQGVKATELMTAKYAETKNIVYYRLGKYDKYGRLLIQMYSDPEMKDSINTAFAGKEYSGLGVVVEAYGGGTKSTYMKTLATLPAGSKAAPLAERTGLGAGSCEEVMAKMKEQEDSFYSAEPEE